jgi:DUF4097 and DUF4098 domain-containing protein YvlB
MMKTENAAAQAAQKDNAKENAGESGATAGTLCACALNAKPLFGQEKRRIQPECCAIFSLNLSGKYFERRWTKIVYRFKIKPRKEVFMKIAFFVLFFVSADRVSAYCNGIMELKPVNEQKIKLDSINVIEILYHSEEVALFKSNTDFLIIKEYMNRDHVNFYAEITNSENKLTVKRGNHLSFRLFYILRARVEVYIPELMMKELTIKTTSGRIVAAEEYICSKINMKSISGSISVNTITADMIHLTATSGSIRCDKITGNITAQTTSGSIALGIVEGDISAKSSSGKISGEAVKGNINIHTASGKIDFDNIGGNAVTEASSGRIELNGVIGSITAKTTSGKIHCSTAENGGNISLASTSGSIHLDIPKNNIFTFSSRTASGSLSTPFSDKLFSPVSDKKTVQGTVGGENGQNITIKTTSGSIKVDWIN